MTRPFEGIRVIDATHVLAGPFATYQLAVLGADVIKVEHPDEPDQSRGAGTDKELNRRNMGTAFLTQASNKRSITLDLKQEKDRETLKNLVATADVFVENYRPGAFEALGLGYEALAAINPRLIYASFSAFGQSGPRGPQTAYDHVIQATSGIMAMTGTREVNPIKFGSPAIDYATGMTGAFALSAALFQRERTGKGQRIDMAMLDVAMILMSSHLTGYLRNGVHPKPSGNRHPHATNGAFATKDGLVMLGASNLRQQRRLWTLLGRPDMIKKTNDERDADHAREIAVLEEIMLTRSADEWETFLQANHVPAARVRTMGEAVADPQLASRGIIHRHEAAPASRAVSACRSRPSRSRMAARASILRRPRSASTTRKFSASLRAASAERNRHFAIAPDFFTSADHLVSSRSMSAAYCSGVVGSGSAPSVAMRRCTSSESSAARSAALSLSTIGARRAGRSNNSIMQHRLEAGQPLLGHRRHIGEYRRALQAGHPERAQLALLDQPDGRRQRGEINRHMVAEQIGERRPGTAVRKWISSMPAVSANNTVPRWMPLPLPAEA